MKGQPLHQQNELLWLHQLHQHQQQQKLPLAYHIQKLFHHH